jgi:hypothetical protein
LIFDFFKAAHLELAEERRKLALWALAPVFLLHVLPGDHAVRNAVGTVRALKQTDGEGETNKQKKKQGQG